MNKKPKISLYVIAGFKSDHDLSEQDIGRESMSNVYS